LGRPNRFDFGVSVPELRVIALTDDLTVPNEDAPDHGIRLDESFPLFGKFQCLPHEIVIAHLGNGNVVKSRGEMVQKGRY
jgi:hypothetical protein